MDDEKAVVAQALLDQSNRAATAAGHVGAIIRAARLALGLSQAGLAARIGYVSQATISRIERASTRAAKDASVLCDLARVLHVPPGTLGVSPPRSPTASSTLDDVRRRDFLGGAAALTAAALLPGSIASLSAVGQPDVDQAWRALERLFELDDLQGGVQLYEVADAMARRMGDALRSGRYGEDVGSGLRAVTATTMEHAGWLAYDAGQGAVARSWWLETIHLARDVGHVPTAHVAALASMSLHASGSPSHVREAAPLAEAARRAAQETPSSPTLLSVLAAREAVGHAQTGDRTAAREALIQARKQLERGPRADDPLWLQFWSPADFACHETRVALAFGDGRLAERSARAALATADEARFPRNHAIYSARLGAVLARTRQLDEAIAVTSAAVKRINDLNGSKRILVDLAATVDHLAAQSYPPARQFARAARRLISAA
ncbi:helix-turn-helix domain-containing protein [Actinomycetospora flava]|uniref:Helix-turn-helix transcriptional regulator n=1 Tax=Actinomycetospora flava TaxID=3129232 RepID=A0ABU8M4X0_9PSEU